MKNKIFRALVALAAMAVLVASGLITFLVSQDYFNETKKELAQEARYISMGLESGGNDFLNKIAAENGSNVRITLIDKEGIVLFDNQAEAKTLENHAMRQEIMEAVAVGAGEAERFSDTLDKTTYYYAVRLEDGKILRLARTIDSIYKSVLQMLPIMGLRFWQALWRAGLRLTLLSLLIRLTLTSRWTTKPMTSWLRF